MTLYWIVVFSLRFKYKTTTKQSQSVFELQLLADINTKTIAPKWAFGTSIERYFLEPQQIIFSEDGGKDVQLLIDSLPVVIKPANVVT